MLASVLSLFCKPVQMVGPAKHNDIYKEAGALGLERLEAVFPKFSEQVHGLRVVEFGCGGGYQVVAMARAGAAQVMGVEIEPHALAHSERLAEAEPGEVKARIQIGDAIPDGYQADIITSQNSFEHFVEPEFILSMWRKALVPGGRAFVTFSPPWYSPWGGHMFHFCRLPWVQVLFPENVVMAVRSRYRDDGVTTYRDVGLAQMSLAKFERVSQASGFQIIYQHYECSWGLHVLRHIPVIRELFVNRVSAILQQPLR